MQQFPAAVWVSERRMYKDKSIYSISHSKKDVGHLTDGVLIFPDDKQIAIEVELTMKTRKRIEDIIFAYVLHKRIKEVWYFCSPEIIDKVKRVAGEWKHVKIYDLE